MISGMLLGGIVSFVIRASLTHEQLVSWGWRIPFVSGIFVSDLGFYLRSHGRDHDEHHYQPPGGRSSEEEENSHNCAGDNSNDNGSDTMHETEGITAPPKNPLLQALSRENLRPLLTSTMVPMLWAAGFYMSFFVWMARFMADLIDDPSPGAFAVNSAALLVSSTASRTAALFFSL
jgi:MHS family proline/betaine transporter-like MFS transporter